MRELRGRFSTRGRMLGWLLAAAMLAGCGSDGDKAAATDTGGSGGDVAADAGSDGGAVTDPAPDCEELDPRHCMLPWPPPKFLVPDAGTPTGHRLAFGPTSLPKNVSGKPIDPAAWNQADGFGVGFGVITLWPDADLQGLPTEDDLAPSLAADAKIALWEVDGDTLERMPFWVEFDDDVDAQGPEDRVLFLRPGFVPREGRRYIVAFRGMVDASGAAFPPSPAFAALRDGSTAGSHLAARQARFDEVFGRIESAGWKRAELQLAWDFWTASHEFLHGDMLTIRDAAMAAAGPKGPTLTVTKVDEFTPEQNDACWLAIEGTFEVPDFTEPIDLGNGVSGKPQQGFVLHRGADGKPKQNGTRKTPFWLRVPQSARDGSAHGLLQYGHGLLGTGSQVKAGHLDRAGRDNRLITFSSNWTGMANPDYLPITAMIFDFSHFHMLPERMHQGMAEFLLLARAMRERLAELPELQSRGVTIDKTRQFYTGDSQGGIYGTTYVALSQEVTRAVLGVPGQNYSLLLRRSTDFIPYFFIMRAQYEGIIDRAILLAGGQVLWDRADPVSYLRHLSEEPFPDTPTHSAIFASAKGDWQVALITNEITVRSKLGVALAPHYGKKVSLVEPTPYPITGSALVNWDFGNPWPAPGPKPPYDTVGDPHGKPRGHPKYIQQMMHFFATGTIIDVCADATCPNDGTP
ncbi:MAG: hypothetical protein RIT45_3336 [Pseudomonadota bacterium]